MFSRRRTHEVCPTSAGARKYIPGFDQGVRSFERLQKRGSHGNGESISGGNVLAPIHPLITLPVVRGGQIGPPLYFDLRKGKIENIW